MRHVPWPEEQSKAEEPELPAAAIPVDPPSTRTISVPPPYRPGTALDIDGDVDMDTDAGGGGDSSSTRPALFETTPQVPLDVLFSLAKAVAAQ